MKKFQIRIKVVGTKLIGLYEAETKEEAEQKALNESAGSELCANFDFYTSGYEAEEVVEKVETFPMYPVKSSNVSKIGYNEQTQILRVQFNNGGLYEYFDVNKNVFEQMQKAESVGSFISKNVAKIYKYKKVEK